MRVLIYEAFEHLRPIGQSLAEGFTEIGHDALVVPARMGPLSSYHALAPDVILAVGMFTRDVDVTPLLPLTAKVPHALVGHVEVERMVEEPPQGTIFALLHEPSGPHRLCREVKTCFAFGRTGPIAGEKCLPMPFASSIKVLELPRIWDFVFIGTWGRNAHGSRGEDSIMRCGRGRRRLFFGGDVSAFSSVPNGLLPWLYGASKVGVNPLYDAQLGRGEVNERAYDLARCGVAQITNSPEVAAAFDGHILTMPTGEFPETVASLLDSGAWQGPDTKEAQKICLERHTWGHRAQTILDAL